MPPEHVRLSKPAKDQLMTLKRRTGVEHWNVLCRFALCRSLAEPSTPPQTKMATDSNVEMTWKVFAGIYGDELWALVRQRCHTDGLPIDEETVTTQFRLHLHRGVGYLVGDERTKTLTGLFQLALEDNAVA